MADSKELGYEPRTARTWAEIDLGRVGHNARVLRQWAPDIEFLGVVKADAYGHGAVRVTAECLRAGITHFGVASVAEGLDLRRAGVSGDIHTLSPFLPQEAQAIVQADLIPMISSREQWDALEKEARNAPLPARCFLKVDTGMGRSGSRPDDARALWDATAGADHMHWSGIAMHFSSADEPETEPSETQSAQFEAFVRSLPHLAEMRDDGRGGSGVWLSMHNSPAALRFPAPPSLPGVRGVLYRAGLLLYGIEPYHGAWGELDLKPVLSWKARIVLLRDMPTGATIGYGQTCTLDRPTRVATLAVGYADGLSRRLSNRGAVLLHGKRLPILGRVSMDQVQIDVTDAPEVVLGDVATLIGSDGAETQTALDIADQVETTPHEPTCALTQRVPRIYTRR